MRFRLLTEADVRAVLTMDDLIETMTSALRRFSTGRVVQPVRPTIPVATTRSSRPCPPTSRGRTAGRPWSAAALGAKLVTVFGGNAARGLHSHLATIVLLDPDTGALLALLDGRYITEARTAAVSAVSSRLLARPTAASLAIIGTGVQARSHLEALSRVHHAAAGDRLESEQAAPRRDSCRRAECTALRRSDPTSISRRRPRRRSGRRRRHHRPRHVVADAGHRERLGEARRARDLGRRLPPDPARDGPGARRARAAVRRFARRRARRVRRRRAGDPGRPLRRRSHRRGTRRTGRRPRTRARRSDTEVTIFKSLGLAVEDVTAADLAYRRAVERGVGRS